MGRKTGKKPRWITVTVRNVNKELWKELISREKHDGMTMGEILNKVIAYYLRKPAPLPLDRATQLQHEIYSLRTEIENLRSLLQENKPPTEDYNPNMNHDFKPVLTYMQSKPPPLNPKINLDNLPDFVKNNPWTGIIASKKRNEGSK